MTPQIRILDPRHAFYLQGFTGRGATTTIHDATATGIRISGIFQAADDFAVLGFYNVYDFFNHLRVKPLPRTDLSGLTLQFDIEYEGGAIRFDANKFPSVAWDAMTVVTGKGIYSPDPALTEIHEVSLLAHAAPISGSETLASAGMGLVDERANWYEPLTEDATFHVYFRDTRYSYGAYAASLNQGSFLSDSNVVFENWFEGQSLCAAVVGVSDTPQNIGDTWNGFREGDHMTLGHLSGGEFVAQAPGQIAAFWETGSGPYYVMMQFLVPGPMVFPQGTLFRGYTQPADVMAELAKVINTPGAEVANRYGPDQTSVIQAIADSRSLTIRFKPGYGDLANIDRVLFLGPTPESGSKVRWEQNGHVRFTGGSNSKKYRVTLPFGSLTDKHGYPVPGHDIRKIYMVFAPRFENVEAKLEDGCFLAAGVGPGDTVWTVDHAGGLSGGVYFIGDATNEERVMLKSAAGTSITVERGYQNSTPRSWPTGTRLKKVSPVTGLASDIEWSARISNLQVTGGNTVLPVGGASERIEEDHPNCTYEGYWERYAWNTGWPTQWWSMGHARRTAPNDAGDLRRVTIRYSRPEQHDLYLGTFLDTDCGKIEVTLDGGAPTVHDLFLSEFGGTTAMVKLRGAVPAGTHTVQIRALIEAHPASTGYYFYFDYLWPLVPQDQPPEPPKVYDHVSPALDFDTDHGYKKPPAWHLWHFEALGMLGHADVYMGVFWNNKRRRVGMSYPWAEFSFAGAPVAGQVVSITIAGTTIVHAIGVNETLQQIADHFRVAVNGMFVAVWADNNFGSSTTLRIQSKAPSYVFGDNAAGSSPNVTIALTDNLGTPGLEGDWEMIDSVSPVMTAGARHWIRDLAAEFWARGLPASFAFSMECYLPPAAMRARYLHLNGSTVEPGEEVLLPIPSHHMHFGTRVRNYLRQMYKECADMIALAGAPIILQFGETQWWYFDNIGDGLHGEQDPEGGMPFYDQETIGTFEARYGRPIWAFRHPTDDPAGDPAHPYETADFLRDRIWEYCADVISYVRRFHATAVFECLWPLDANQGREPGVAVGDWRRLNLHVNLPHQWKTSSYGVKYFRSEAFDYDVIMKRMDLVEQAMRFPLTVGRAPGECIFLSGIFGPPDPPLRQSYAIWKKLALYSFSYWAFDQFCLNSRPVPLEAPTSKLAPIQALYHKPRAARAREALIAKPVAVPASGALNRFRLNTRKLNV